MGLDSLNEQKSLKHDVHDKNEMLLFLCGLSFKNINNENMIMYIFTYVLIIIIINHLASSQLGLPQVVMDWGADITPTNT